MVRVVYKVENQKKRLIEEFTMSWLILIYKIHLQNKIISEKLK